MAYSGDRSASTGRGGPLLFTNFLPARFAGQVVAGVLPYESAGHLEGLRSRLGESHVVVRDRNDVVCVPLARGAEQIGERRVIASTARDVLLQSRLLEEGSVKFSV